MKVCKNCRVPKDELEFPLHGSRPGLRRLECAKCNSKARLARKSKNREAANAAMRRWHGKNKARVNAKQKARYHANPERAAEIARKSKYGVTPDMWAELTARHAGRCAICEGKKPLCIDHDHTTGAVRGLLCATCNRAIGLLKDSSSIARSAASYLDLTARLFPVS